MSDDQLESRLLNASSDDQPTREEAIRALGDRRYRGDAQVIDALCVALSDRTENARAYRVRELAAQALGIVAPLDGDASTVNALLIALEDENSMVKTSAAEALGKIGDPAAVNLLIGTLKDKNAEVRQAAINALRAINTAETSAFIPLLADADDTVRQMAAEAIAAHGTNALKPLIDALRDPNSTIRGAAADLLGRLKDERAREALQYTAKEDKSEWVKGRAKAALEQLPPPLFVPPQVKRGVAPPPPSDTLRLLREQAPEMPSLRPKNQMPIGAVVQAVPLSTVPTPPASSADPQTMSADQVQAVLDQLDLRLVNGEITEATYHRLAERWEARLQELQAK